MEFDFGLTVKHDQAHGVVGALRLHPQRELWSCGARTACWASRKAIRAVFALAQTAEKRRWSCHCHAHSHSLSRSLCRYRSRCQLTTLTLTRHGCQRPRRKYSCHSNRCCSSGATASGRMGGEAFLCVCEMQTKPGELRPLGQRLTSGQLRHIIAIVMAHKNVNFHKFP